MTWYIEALKKYGKFEGRARRKEYWMFSLISVLVSIILSFIDTMVRDTGGDLGALSLIYALLILLPSLSVTVRRLHDVGKSGWFILLSFIPIIGTIWLFVLTCKDSESGKNRFGENPKEEVVLEC